MFLHSILQNKVGRWARLRPLPDYSGLTALERVRAKCADAKREVDRVPRKRVSLVKYGDCNEVRSSAVWRRAWTVLGMKGGAE
jgi:hypothetical protein